MAVPTNRRRLVAEAAPPDRLNAHDVAAEVAQQLAAEHGRVSAHLDRAEPAQRLGVGRLIAQIVHSALGPIKRRASVRQYSRGTVPSVAGPGTGNSTGPDARDGSSAHA